MIEGHIECLNQDLLNDIMAHLDGPALASAASSCTHLRAAARDEALWHTLCNATWPSTLDPQVQALVKSTKGGFVKFFADSFPLILNEPTQPDSVEHGLSSGSVEAADLVSLVDIFYRGKCIFSKVLWGMSSEEKYPYGFFSEGPFRIDLLNFEGNGGDEEDDNNDEMPLMCLLRKREKGTASICRKLQKNLRLSWVSVDKRGERKGVNLSSWEPVVIQGHWPSETDFLVRFGSVVARGPARFVVISVRCRLDRGGACLKMAGISLEVEDSGGSRVWGSEGVMTLAHAASCKRGCDRTRSIEGYASHVRAQRREKERRIKGEWMADWICVGMGISVFFAALGWLATF
ncbi:hypothetical protein AMTRI_Chr09g37180 [Amborella trichopoda]|uniref:F-box domain-containing protein n=1 Tax=Amborella trichopoda TaxID=13333 RepID=W1PLR9_AMBTC|nr:probable F-box protein At2g36090 [Amborella trichopoda]ERN08100.1 hypothetical protein AMTR_s00018p00031290 [Amborella trichopoda]|eukprot:XP_006846425.3 probable F-box protein At2g36090 [Amborella trichopoda]